MLSLA